MAWPKGKSRRPQPVPPEIPRVAVGAPVVDIQADTQVETEQDRLLAVRRAICAYRVRNQQVPRELRIHDHTSLYVHAKVIRREMAADHAPDSAVPEYVARHVERV